MNDRQTCTWSHQAARLEAPSRVVSTVGTFYLWPLNSALPLNPPLAPARPATLLQLYIDNELDLGCSRFTPTLNATKNMTPV